MGAARPKTGTTERQAAQEATRAPPCPPQAPPMLMRALLPRRGRGGAIKILGCAAQNLLRAHIQPPLFPCRRFALPSSVPQGLARSGARRKKTQNQI